MSSSVARHGRRTKMFCRTLANTVVSKQKGSGTTHGDSCVVRDQPTVDMTAWAGSNQKEMSGMRAGRRARHRRGERSFTQRGRAGQQTSPRGRCARFQGRAGKALQRRDFKGGPQRGPPSHAAPRPSGDAAAQPGSLRAACRRAVWQCYSEFPAGLP